MAHFPHHLCTPSRAAADDATHAGGSDAGTSEIFRVVQPFGYAEVFVGVLYTTPTPLAHATKRTSRGRRSRPGPRQMVAWDLAGDLSPGLRVAEGNFSIQPFEDRPPGTVADGASGIGCGR